MPFVPFLKWLDSGSVLRNENSVAIGQDNFDRIYRDSMIIDGSELTLEIALSSESSIPLTVVDGIFERYRKLEQFIKKFNLIDGNGIVIQLRLVEGTYSIESVYRDYYFYRPKSVFYLTVGRYEDLGWIWKDISTIIHELFHYRRIASGKVHMGDEIELIREELAASVVEYCSVFFGALSEPAVYSVRHSASLDQTGSDGRIPLSLYRELGPTIVGSVIAGYWVLGEYVQTDPSGQKMVVMKANQKEEFMESCGVAFEKAEHASVTKTGSHLIVEGGWDDPP